MNRKEKEEELLSNRLSILIHEIDVALLFLQFSEYPLYPTFFG